MTQETEDSVTSERDRERERERENENTAVKDTARSSGKPAVYSLDIDSAERFY